MAEETRNSLEVFSNVFREMFSGTRSTQEVIGGKDCAIVHSKQCFFDMEPIRELGLKKESDICNADEIGLASLARSIDPRIVVKITRSVARGDTHCEFVFRYLSEAELQVQGSGGQNPGEKNGQA